MSIYVLYKWLNSDTIHIKNKLKSVFTSFWNTDKLSHVLLSLFRFIICYRLL